MRKPHFNQKRFDCHAVNQVRLNLNCRDEIIPVLQSLQHIYGKPALRQEILKLVALDVNHDSRHDRGREGLDDWQILVLAGVRLGCHLNDDKLQDLAEQHRALRHIMGIGDWQDHVDFNWRRIHDNVGLLQQTERLLRRAQDLCEQALARPNADVNVALQTASIKHFVELTQQVCGTARRRVLLGEAVPNADKLFSIFEPHRQLYKRGKAGEPVQFGRLLLVYEDAAGFLVHQHLMDRDAQDVDVPVAQTRALQWRLQNRIEEISFDCGFHSPENQTELAKIVPLVCLAKKGKHQAAEQNASATAAFRRARRRHSGVEAAMGALQAGNGLKRCRDKTELGFDRYLALGVFGRNLHTLGKLLIARENESANAAYSKRQAACASHRPQPFLTLAAPPNCADRALLTRAQSISEANKFNSPPRDTQFNIFNPDNPAMIPSKYRASDFSDRHY